MVPGCHLRITDSKRKVHPQIALWELFTFSVPRVFSDSRRLPRSPLGALREPSRLLWVKHCNSSHVFTDSAEKMHLKKTNLPI